MCKRTTLTALVLIYCCCGSVVELTTDVLAAANDAIAQDSEESTESNFVEEQAGLSPNSNDQASAEDPLAEILAGHSYHGDAFNEGPRQRGYLMGGTGQVNFPVTTHSAEAQAFIHQGVGQLHGFWDLEAERSFRQAAALDEDCAMAYWGAALASLLHPERAKGFIAKAVELKKQVTRREQMYIDALDKYLMDKPEKKSDRAEQYIKDLETLSLEFPDDLESKAFIAHRIWQNSREGVKISSYLAADALIREILQANPLHPAHHYMIHLWDYRHAEKALESAARCGVSAPNIAHMWHMPGHIYSRLHRYEDAIYHQEASARVDHAHMIRDRVMPDEIHNYAHNNEWLIRNLLFVGRVSDAVSLAENMISLPCHPKYNTLQKQSKSASHGRRRMLQALSLYQLYDQTIEYCHGSILPLTEIDEEQLRRDRWLACSAVMTGDDEIQHAAIGRIQRMLAEHQRIVDEADALIADCNSLLNRHESLPLRPSISRLNEAEAAEKKKEATKSISQSSAIVKRAENSIHAVSGYDAFRKNDFVGAHKLLKKAGDEDKSWLAEILFLAGERDKALKEIDEQVKKRPQEVVPLARQIYLHAQAADMPAVKQAFENLRNSSTMIEVSHPLFARLNPLAIEAGFGIDWVKPQRVRPDVLYRPRLDDLGPLTWSPATAPEWQLLTPEGTLIGSSDFQRQAYLVIFYLGHGCLHCAEQLQAFGPAYDQFKQSGIEILAISTDDDNGLLRSLEDYGGDMPIRLLSNEDHTVFKAFRAFDDFENQPLHGTFLIDAEGKIRWQDIGYEPFMDHGFLRSEVTRLLKQETPNRRSSQLTLND